MRRDARWLGVRWCGGWGLTVLGWEAGLRRCLLWRWVAVAAAVCGLLCRRRWLVAIAGCRGGSSALRAKDELSTGRRWKTIVLLEFDVARARTPVEDL